MKKLVFLLFASFALTNFANAQKPKKATKDSSQAVKTYQPQPIAPKKDWNTTNLNNRPADHFVVQLGYDGWAGKPDSIKTKGVGRHFNFYVMMDKPFKTNPHYSVAYGAGIGTSNIYFDNQVVNLAGTGNTLPFNTLNGDHYARFKLTTIFAEIPAELRYYQNPENTNKGWKFAIGAKAGLLLKAYTKGKDLQNSAGTSYYGKTYIEKVTNKKFINSTKVAVSARIGYGIVSLHGDYSILGVIKDGLGPTINTYSIGVSIGGL